MKILIVNCVYGFGSTGKVIRDIVSGLDTESVEVVVAYGRGGATDGPCKVVKLSSEIVMKAQSFLSKLTGDVYGCSPISTRRLFRLIEDEHPDLVNLHCINANIVNMAETIAYLKNNHIKTVLSIHAEFPYTGGCGHAYECEEWKTGCVKCDQFHKPYSQLPESWFFCRTHMEWKRLETAYKDFKELLITCVSPWLASRAEQSPFFVGRRIVPVLNGLDDEVFQPRDDSRLRELHNLNGKKVVLHVTPNFYFSLKGGNYVLEVARRLEIEQPDTRVVICGYRGTGEDLPKNVIAVPFTRNQYELSEYYSLADLTLVTSRRETFCMVVAESLCCGTPVVAFKAGGPESIAIKAGSVFCEYGDTDALYRNVVNVITGETKLEFDANEARNKYSKRTMQESYLKVYEDHINQKI